MVFSRQLTQSVLRGCGYLSYLRRESQNRSKGYKNMQKVPEGCDTYKCSPKPLRASSGCKQCGQSARPRKKVTDLKLPNEPKAKERRGALYKQSATPAAAVMASSRRSLWSPVDSHMANPSKLFWMMNFPLAANDCGSS